MIGYLSNKSRIVVAWMLFFVFYLQFAATAFINRSLYLAVMNDQISYSDRHDTGAAGNSNNYPQLLSPKTTSEDHNKPFVVNPQRGNLEQPEVGGPGQPEMATFKSISVNDMVNTFTGDFSYNIPLLDIGGYPLNIFYNAGPTMEQDASWVGLGWNINPGTVSRTMRGIPDDFNGKTNDPDIIVKEQNIKPDLTVSAKVGGNAEFVGFPHSHLNRKWNFMEQPSRPRIVIWRRF